MSSQSEALNNGSVNLRGKLSLYDRAQHAWRGIRTQGRRFIFSKHNHRYNISKCQRPVSQSCQWKCSYSWWHYPKFILSLPENYLFGNVLKSCCILFQVFLNRQANLSETIEAISIIKVTTKLKRSLLFEFAFSFLSAL